VIPQPKPEPLALVPWDDLEMRRQQAANDTRFADLDDGQTKNNWTMLFASICAFAVAAIVLGASVVFAGKLLYANWPAIRPILLEVPLHYYAIGFVSLAALCVLIVAGRRAIRASRASRAAATRHAARQANKIKGARL
jgi:hypothetical protein